MKEYEVEYLIHALEFICEHGYKFLPEYVWDPVSGSWHHKLSINKKPTFGICNILGEER